MSFAPSKPKKKPLRESLSNTPAGSGGTSPVIVQCSVSSTNALRPATGLARNTSNVTVRSTSYAHAASHAKAAAPSTPSRSNRSPARQFSRSPCYNHSSFLRLPYLFPYMPVFFYDVANLL